MRHELTCDRIKEITSKSMGGYELVLGEYERIIEAADGSKFDAICYAYAYGFFRGQQAEKARRRKKNAK